MHANEGCMSRNVSLVKTFDGSFGHAPVSSGGLSAGLEKGLDLAAPSSIWRVIAHDPLVLDTRLSVAGGGWGLCLRHPASTGTSTADRVGRESHNDTR